MTDWIGAPATGVVCPDCGFANAPDTGVCEACGVNVFRPERTETGSLFVGHLVSDVVDAVASPVGQFIAAGSTVADAVAAMRTSGAGCILVAVAGEIRGIFTEGDLLTRVLAAGKVPHAVAIEEVMTPDPVVLRQDDSLAIAINKMVMGNFRHIPLVDADGHVRGVKSSHDLLSHLHRLMHEPDSDT